MENEKDLDEGGIEWIGQVKRILAEAKAKAALLAEEAMKDFHATQATTLTGFEKNNSFVETKAIEKGGSKAIEWLIPLSKTVEEAKAFGENYRKFIERIIEVSRRVLEMGEFFRKKEAIQETAGQEDDMGGDWMKNALLKMFMTKPESLFDKGGIPQSLKTWQACLPKERPLPLEEFQKLQEEKLTEISEMEVTPELRTRIHDNLFRISVRGGEYGPARDFVWKSIAETAKGAKKEDENAVLAKIMKIKGDIEEIKDIIRRIKEKDSEPTPRERGTARSDLTTSLEASEWIEDELLEDVRKGLLPR